MGNLFLDPLVLNDGTDDNNYDHISDTEDKQSQITTRENMSVASIENDLIIVKQSKVREPLYRAAVIKTRSCLIPDTDGQRDNLIITVSVKSTKRIADAVVQAELTKVANAIVAVGFVAGLTRAKS